MSSSSLCPCLLSLLTAGSSDAAPTRTTTPLLADYVPTTSEDMPSRTNSRSGASSGRLRPTNCEGHGEPLLDDRGQCTHAYADVYANQEQIGKGATSSCFKCVHKRSGNVLAVKIIDKRRVAMMFPELLVQFRSEVSILRMLAHPHIIKLYEVFESEVSLSVVTEFVPGGELFDYLVERPDRLLSEHEASGIMRQVAWAIAYMHTHGVMHRDLKLENILVASRPADDEDCPTIKVIDFGLAKIYFNTAAEQQQPPPLDPMSPTANTFFGTVGYIAPEMIKRRGYTHHVDNWAMGVLLYVLLCGVFPFDDDPRVRSSNNEYLVKYPPWAKISDSAKDLLRKLLEVNPSKRLTAGKALQHPWVTGETASRNAILGTPRLLEELKQKHLYGSSTLRATAAAGGGVEPRDLPNVSPLTLDTAHIHLSTQSLAAAVAAGAATSGNGAV
jgi:serine/threonine protein kinase